MQAKWPHPIPRPSYTHCGRGSALHVIHILRGWSFYISSNFIILIIFFLDFFFLFCINMKTFTILLQAQNGIFVFVFHDSFFIDKLKQKTMYEFISSL